MRWRTAGFARPSLLRHPGEGRGPTDTATARPPYVVEKLVGPRPSPGRRVFGICRSPRRRTRDNATRMKQRATAGAGVLESRTSVACVAILRTTDGNHAKRPFGPVASGGDGAGSRPCRHTLGAYPRLNVRAPIVPVPDVIRQCGAHHLRALAVKRGRRSEALTAPAPVAGSIQPIWFLLSSALYRRTSSPNHSSPRTRCGPSLFFAREHYVTKAAPPPVKHGATGGDCCAKASLPTSCPSRNFEDRAVNGERWTSEQFG